MNPPPPGSPLGAFPAGSYALDIRPEDTGNSGNVGFWVLTFEADADFMATRNGTIAVQGNVLVSNDQIIIRDLAGSFSCAPPTDKGTYKWAVSGGQLSLTVVSDGCGGRRDALTAGAYAKQ